MIKLNDKIKLIGTIAAVFLIAVGIFYGTKFNEEKATKQVADKAVAFINENLLSDGVTASYVSILEESGLYKLKIKVETAEPEVYVTKNGKLLFVQGVIDMNPATATENLENQNTTGKATCETLAKVKEPLLEAFVVSACPYGLQMQRILAEIVTNIPSLAANIKVAYMGAMENNKITAMHGDAEAQENLKQICIREEQANTYWEYVGCYIKAGDSEGCLSSSGVNKAKLNTCMTDTTKGIEYAKADFASSNQYGVTGSPTLILNGSTVSEFDFGGRTAEALKTVICCGAQEQPEACSKALETASAALSFSDTYTNSGSSNNSASCE